MKDTIYTRLVESLMVDIIYEYEEGDKGDYFSPPTGDRVTIVGWRLSDGEAAVRKTYADYTEEEWWEWMRDIDLYVHYDAEWDIIEYEKKKI